MINFENIINSLETINISNEKYYKLCDLRRGLIPLKDEKIEVTDFILTPYYIYQGKRLELYEYEFNMVLVEKNNLEEYLLTLTGKKSIEEVPNSIKERQKFCYVEVMQDNKTVDVFCLINYIDYLLDNSEIRYQIEKVFGIFNTEELFFELF